MSIEIPQPNIRRWSGPYLGNYYGDLWRTFNVDLDKNPGHVSLSMNFNKVGDTQNANLTHLGLVDNFLRTNADGQDKWWGVCRKGRLVKTDSSNPIALTLSSWLEDTLALSPTDALDMAIHENDSDSASGDNILLVTRATEISSLNDTAANTWNDTWWGGTKAQPALKSSVPHPIEYFPLRRITLIGDGNFIHTVDKNKTVSYARLILPSYLQIWGIFSTPLRVWILCGGTQGHNGAIVEWDGSASTYNNIHDAQSSHVITGVNYNGVPIVVNNRGLVLEFDGNSFSPMIRNGQTICFPSFAETDNGFLFPDFTQGIRYIAPRGMTVTDDGLIYINAEGPFFASQRHLAGVWCLNPYIGRLYSKHSFSLGSDTTDFGQQGFSGTGNGVGALKAVSAETGAGTSGLLLAGAIIYPAGALPAIWMLGRNFSGQSIRQGYFITQYIPASDIQEFWDTVWLKIAAFRKTTDKIIVKAKGVNTLMDVNRLTLELTITWTSGTTFTATNGNGTDNDNILVGDEIEIVSGKNAGSIAHITNITGNQGAQQTFTIDETVSSVSGTSRCRFDRWKKIGTITDMTKYTVPHNIGITSSFIMLKILMKGFPGVEVKGLIINPKTQTQAKK